jgi:SAM-dependent methyltransferase
MRQIGYRRLAAAAYSQEDPQNRGAILEFYLRCAEDMPSPYLEPMCGTGYFLLPLLERGAVIDGLDASEHMLAICQRECAERGYHPTLMRQSLPDVVLLRQYGYIFIPDRSFGLLDEDEARATLVRLRQALVPGGRMVFDVAPPRDRWEDRGTWETSWETLTDGSILVQSVLMRHEQGGTLLRALEKYEQFTDGRLVETELDEYAERFYAPLQIEALCLASGFSRVETQRGFGTEAPHEQSRIILICEP